MRPPRDGGQAGGISLVWSMDVRLDAHPRSLRIARKIASTAALAAGASPQAALELETALGEALSNALLHAYGGEPRGRIVIHFAFTEDALTITVRDGGRALREVPRIPSDVGTDRESGRGLFLMSRLMDDLEVVHPDRRGRGTAIKMTKRLSADSPLVPHSNGGKALLGRPDRERGGHP